LHCMTYYYYTRIQELTLYYHVIIQLYRYIVHVQYILLHGEVSVGTCITARPAIKKILFFSY
jgi:hypothetical protein